MTRALIWTWIALFSLAGCNDEGQLSDDDDSVGDDDTMGDDDDTNDLGCNEPSTRTLGWDEAVEWWSDTPAVARSTFEGEWAGGVPWADATPEPMELALGEPIAAPVLTTYPNADANHALDACLPYATFAVPVDVTFPHRGFVIVGEASIEISEMTNRWDLYLTAVLEECVESEACYLSLGAWADTTVLIPTLMARPTLTLADMVHGLDSGDYVYLTHSDDPEPPTPGNED